MKARYLAVLACAGSLALVGGCRKVHQPEAAPLVTAAAATPAASDATESSDLVPLSDWTVKMVTARNVVRPGEVSGITDHFNLNSKIFTHATLTSRHGARAGSHSFAVKWFDGLNVITEQSAVYDVKASPFFVAASTSGVTLGAGAHRVELFADGRYLGSTQFTVETW